MDNAIFITGTDTSVGKTVITGLLGRFLAAEGMNVITQKWVQTGSSEDSPDISTHIEFMGGDAGKNEEYRALTTPYILEFPSSPHLAASLEKKRIDANRIEGAFYQLEKEFDFVLVEGSGGLMVPIDEENLIIDIAENIGLGVLIVAENRLGAINQTLLTVEALKRRNMPIVGIVFNRLTELEEEVILKDNIEIIGKLTGEEVLGELGYNKDKDIDAFYKDFIPIGESILGKMRSTS